jgi:diamine N-acetyltransferase
MSDAAKRRDQSGDDCPGDGLPWGEVTLTPLEETDLDLVHAWQNSAAVRDLTMGFRFPIQKDTVRAWLRDLGGAGQPSRAAYAIRTGGAAVGIVQLYDIAAYQRRATLGIFLGSPGHRGAGIGHVATALILDFAFNGLDLRKVGLEVLGTNAAAVRMYESLGFQREGIKRQEYFADGACWDSHVYGLLRADFSPCLPPAAQRLCLPMRQK